MSAEDVHRIADRIASKLDMDDAQKEKMRTLSDKISAKLPEMQSRRKEMSSVAIRQFESGTFNTQEVSGIMSEHEKSMRGMHDFMVASLAEFHAILTPEQRTKVAAFMKKWSDRGIH
jgi:Spy/CpxP family protein refolding chaperone